MGVLRMIAIILGVAVLAIVVLTAGTAFMPGTKIGHLFGASAEALAGDTSTPPERSAAAPDAGTGADAGTQGR